MPLDTRRCECGDEVYVCPNCGGTHVTPRDDHRKPSPTKLVDRGGPTTLEYRHVCWDCGWDETVTVTIERS